MAFQIATKASPPFGPTIRKGIIDRHNRIIDSHNLLQGVIIIDLRIWELQINVNGRLSENLNIRGLGQKRVFANITPFC